MKVAIIGLGKMGTHHKNACAKLGIDVIPCDIKFKSSWVTAINHTVKPHIYSYCNFKDVPVDKIDAVIIATSTPTHFNIAKYFISCGVKTFIEKPMCIDSECAYYLQELAFRNNVQLMVGHIERFNPVIQRITFEDTKNIRSITTIRKGYSPKAKSNIIGDLMIHDIDTISHLLNFQKIPKHIYSIINGEHFAQSILNYDGIPVTHQVDRKSKHITRQIHITSNTHYYHLDLFNKSFKIYDSINRQPCFSIQCNEDALMFELIAFFGGYDNAESSCRNVETVENILKDSIKWKK